MPFMAKKAEKRPRGRPRKEGTSDHITYVRLPEPLWKAVQAYREQNLLPSEAEAIRDILKKKLLQ